jgi:hypothetical protein
MQSYFKVLTLTKGRTMELHTHFKKTAEFKGTQAEYERAVHEWAKIYKDGFDGDEARSFVGHGIRSDHVSQRIKQLQNRP